jgi:hypothetical protein
VRSSAVHVRNRLLSLAHALETYKTLSGDDVIAVIERRPGPFVDGRMYADSGLLLQLREYHREAAVAHREHSKISLSLPGVPEPALALALAGAGAGAGAQQWLVTPHPDPLGRSDHPGVNDHPDGDGSPLETEPGSGPAPSRGS